MAGLALLTLFKKELQDAFKSLSKKLYGRLFRGHIARRVTDAELKQVLGSGLVGLETLLLLLLKEYRADRVTVTEYELAADGSVLATCLVEVRSADMQSVQSQVQALAIDPVLWQEIQRIHNQFGRWRYVADARTEDVAPLRAALLNSGVWSAYYQSLPNDKGECRAMLALSWHNEHLLSAEQLAALHLSGSACGTVLLLMAAWKPTSTD